MRRCAIIWFTAGVAVGVFYSVALSLFPSLLEAHPWLYLVSVLVCPGVWFDQVILGWLARVPQLAGSGWYPVCEQGLFLFLQGLMYLMLGCVLRWGGVGTDSP